MRSETCDMNLKENFFSHSYHERSIQSMKKLFSTLTLVKNFFSFGQTWEKILPQLSKYIDLLGKQIFFSNIKFCTLFRKTLNFCISLILEKKERGAYMQKVMHIICTYLLMYMYFFLCQLICQKCH